MDLDEFLYKPTRTFFYFVGPSAAFAEYVLDIRELPAQSALVIRRLGRIQVIQTPPLEHRDIEGFANRALELTRSSSEVSLITLQPQLFLIPPTWDSMVELVGQVVDASAVAKNGPIDVYATLRQHIGRHIESMRGRRQPFHTDDRESMAILLDRLRAQPPLDGINFDVRDLDTLLYPDRSPRFSTSLRPDADFEVGLLIRRSTNRDESQREDALPQSSTGRVQAAIWTSSDANAGQAIRAALVEFIADYDLLVERSGDEEFGSWWQRFTLRAKKAYNHDKVQENLARAERRLELELLDKHAAQVDNLKADSASKLIGAINSTNQAVVILGQIVIVKYRGTIVVKSIDPLTAAKIERSNALLTDPAAVLQILSESGGDPAAIERTHDPHLEQG